MDDDKIREIFETGRLQVREQRSLFGTDTIKVGPTWELLRTYDKDEAITKAIESGWAEGEVQVKEHQLGPDLWEYYVEPFEVDCHCPSLLKYEDYAPDK